MSDEYLQSRLGHGLDSGETRDVRGLLRQVMPHVSTLTPQVAASSYSQNSNE